MAEIKPMTVAALRRLMDQPAVAPPVREEQIALATLRRLVELGVVGGKAAAA